MKDADKMSERELRAELRVTRGLLAAAECPHNPFVSADATLLNEHSDQCQWCAERSELLAY